VHAAGERRIPEAQFRRIVVDDERVDTGAAYVSMPLLLINQLGLKRLKTVQARTDAGSVTFGIFEPVKLTIQGRDCEVRVAEVADNCPVLIGFLPLEQLDFVVDSKNQRLIGNRDHVGEFMIDMIAIHERQVPAV
jgi:predicted aspartyl protease